jgi:hypothetical protein
MRFAYADPPYPGLARKYYKNEPTYAGEVDHAALIASLEASGYDGWALSTSRDALRTVLPLCPEGAKVCPWVKPIGTSSRTRGLHNTWEPLIVVRGRELQPGKRDWLCAQPARGGGSLPGRKPLAFCAFLFDALGMLPGDELDDLFPGTGVVSRAWAALSPRTSHDVSPGHRGDALPSLRARGDVSQQYSGDRAASMALPTVAALYVQPEGAYYGLEGVDPWDEARDARTYAGPWPVVAHPPCASWCRLAWLRRAIYGLPIGEDGGCFAAALDAVRRWGGVLEHPAWSLAWGRYDLPRPPHGAWQRALCGGWVAQVSQAAYGHCARKLTWLYAYGVVPPELDARIPPATHVLSDLSNRGRSELPRLRRRSANATPPAFRDLLLGIARSASGFRRSNEPVFAGICANHE